MERATLEQKEISQSPGSVWLGRIARLFPGATPVRIPVSVAGACPRVADMAEETVIEFGTSDTIFFSSDLPLEINDLILVHNDEGTLEADAVIMAVQHSEDCRAVAAKFLWPVPNWILKP